MGDNGSKDHGTRAQWPRYLSCPGAHGLGREEARALQDLEARIGAVEKLLRELLNRGALTIGCFHVERLRADKLQFKLRSIKVKDLSGMLNVGLNRKIRYKRTKH